MRVLIVDDQSSQRTMLRHLVEDISKDIQVTDFSDPVHALLWSQKQPPDLVILDYRMPKMDGDELEIDEPLVRRLLTDQFPEWAGLPLRSVEPTGTDNAIFRLGE